MAQAHEELAIRRSWWEEKYKAMNNNLADKVEELATVREELANARVQNEDTNTEIVAAYEELKNLKKQNEDKLKDLVVARESLAIVTEQNNDKVKELAVAHGELAKVTKNQMKTVSCCIKRPRLCLWRH